MTHDEFDALLDYLLGFSGADFDESESEAYEDFLDRLYIESLQDELAALNTEYPIGWEVWDDEPH